MQQQRLERVVLRPARKSPAISQHPGRAPGGLIAREQGSPAARLCTSPISRCAAPTRTARESARCGHPIVAEALAGGEPVGGRTRSSARVAVSAEWIPYDHTSGSGGRLAISLLALTEGRGRARNPGG